MNAYDLADALDNFINPSQEIKESQTMLRQQADLIAGLEEENERLYEAMERAFEGLESSLQLNKALLKERSK